MTPEQMDDLCTRYVARIRSELSKDREHSEFLRRISDRSDHRALYDTAVSVSQSWKNKRGKLLEAAAFDFLDEAFERTLVERQVRIPGSDRRMDGVIKSAGCDVWCTAAVSLRERKAGTWEAEYSRAGEYAEAHNKRFLLIGLSTDDRCYARAMEWPQFRFFKVTDKQQLASFCRTVRAAIS